MASFAVVHNDDMSLAASVTQLTDFGVNVFNTKTMSMVFWLATVIL
jgi:hypothetical protein